MIVGRSGAGPLLSVTLDRYFWLFHRVRLTDCRLGGNLAHLLECLGRVLLRGGDLGAQTVESGRLAGHLSPQRAQRRLVPFDRSQPIRQILVHHSQHEMQAREGAQLAVSDSFVCLGLALRDRLLGGLAACGGFRLKRITLPSGLVEQRLGLVAGLGLQGCDLVVGADGWHSRVAQSVRPDQPGLFTPIFMITVSEGVGTTKGALSWEDTGC